MLKLPVSKLKDLFLGRAVAYNKVFNKESPFTAVVLMDLAKFCRIHDTTFHTDPRVHAMMEGRREVALRIFEYLELDIGEIYQLHRVYDHSTKEN